MAAALTQPECLHDMDICTLWDGLGEHIYLPFFDLPGKVDGYVDYVLDPRMKVATAAAAWKASRRLKFL